MSEPGILRLDEYRERREQRLRLAASLYRADPARADLLGHLARTAALLGADRAATVWIDEYGAGLVHPHVVLDLLSDRPRRAFAADPLRRAWESGVPGVHESFGSAPGAPVRGEGPLGWTVAVALGSDGTRSWFLVADAVSAGRPLGEAVRDRLLFLAGECSAVVLHRDLDAMIRADAEDARGAQPRFAGWPILQDIEGREDDEAESRLISIRFLVARLPRLLADDDLAVPADRLREQAERAREEMVREAGALAEAGVEGEQWKAVLDAFQEGDLERLGSALLAMGETVESRMHHHGAVELYRTAYELFVATGRVAAAVDAARFAGRALRRLARWDESLRWYGVAREVAQAAELPAKVALVLDGTANHHRERGNFPAARAALAEALALAEASGEAQAIGAVYHGHMGLEHQAGRLADAVAWGWKAVRAYPGREEQVTALASLGGVLIDLGHLTSAWDAWSCVRVLSTNDYYRIYALDALGHIAALQGDREAFVSLSKQADALDEGGAPSPMRAEILYYRGLSHRALGDVKAARKHLERAVAFAEEHGFSRTLFAAESALEALDAAGREAKPEAPSPAPEVSGGLREMRLALEGAASPG